jgi:DNA-binding transcriptional LysR family regulator
MKLHQLRSAQEVVAQGLNLTRAAERLNASQPGLTRHLQLLERDLGVALFVRNGRRIAGLTAAGRALMPIIGRVLRGAEDLARVAREQAAGIAGEVTVATIHTHARYVLPPFIERFVRDHPAVRLRLLQGSRAEVAAWVSGGEADFSLASAPREAFPDLVFHPCYTVHRLLLTRHDHPLAGRARVRLEDIARYPLVTYDHAAPAWAEILHAFEHAGLRTNIVLGALDADLMKTYVRSGLGIGILAHVAYDQEKETDLHAIDCRHLFAQTVVHVGIRRRETPTRHALDLIALFAPAVRRALGRPARRPRATRGAGST